MKVLMFGWEFPPHISGGLGTACYGLTRALSVISGINLTFVVPKIWGDEPTGAMHLLGASEIDLVASKIKAEAFKTPFTYLSVQSGMLPYIDPEAYSAAIENIQKKASGIHQQDPFANVRFTGAYHSDLMAEIHNFSVVGEYISQHRDVDLIHAHDWLTFPAGIKAKQATGKPLVIHVHATEFDRSGGNANPQVYNIEKAGMDAADRIITVSNHTKEIVSEKYFIDKTKITTVHNGVEPFTEKEEINVKAKKKTRKTVTFLGRITTQKGPQYFVEVARKILSRIQNVEFLMAGSGDLLQPVIKLVNDTGLRDNFTFPGFLKGREVRDCLKHSDVFIMPSVSEPFGISPLEAMYCNVPVIISRQSGVSEVIQHAIKADYWDTDTMADAVYSILTRPVLSKTIKKKGAREVLEITWGKSAQKVMEVYNLLLSA